ncbi:efflux RND transporter periplasmic adaptor subunit [Gallibacterium melopsittaci]|uniref:Efflux RND transporter periplasmic adaptor subunit n=1 Tax=Gallibacterium melopsittaci TaxID=516063 RepID=A0ABV6HV23_9PAST
MRMIILFLSLFSLFCSGCQKQDTQSFQAAENNDSSLKISVIKPQQIDFAKTLKLSGTWVAKEEIAIGTALQDQQVLSVLVEAGDHVKKGQILATLEYSNVQSQLKQNQAALVRAKANLMAQQAALKEAKITLKRYQALVAADAISRQEVDQQTLKVATAKAAIQTAQAEILQIQAQLADSRHQRNKAEVLAPAAGVITKRNAVAGALTVNGQALFYLAKQGETEFEAEVNAEERALLHLGLAVQVNIATQREPIAGTVRLISPEIDTKTRLGKVRIALSQPQMQAIGAYGEAQIILPTQKVAHTVPFSALIFDAENKTSVFVVNADNIVERRAVMIGQQYQSWTEIVSGLQDNEQVIRKATAFVNEGDHVVPQLVKD